MANYILKNDIDILRLNNFAMDVFFEAMQKIVCDKGLSENVSIKHFLDNLNQELCGRGLVYLEIGQYFDQEEGKLPLAMLFELVQKVIERIRQDNKLTHEFREAFIALLEEFKSKIL